MTGVVREIIALLLAIFVCRMLLQVYTEKNDTPIFNIAKYRLRQEIESQSPHTNASFWLCPQGFPGLMAPFPRDITGDYMQLDARCEKYRKTYKCSVEKVVNHVMVNMQALKSPTKRYTSDGMLGPASHDHPHQRQYCRSLIESSCDRRLGLPACDIFEDLLRYGVDLVANQRRQCGHEPLIGAPGPPAAMNVYDCDLYLRHHGE